MSGRRSTPRGQMTRGANSGPAVMLMPPHIRATFVPNPPLQHFPPTKARRKNPITGVSSVLSMFEKEGETPERQVRPTPKSIKDVRRKRKEDEHRKKLEPLVSSYRKDQRECGGEFEGMNCYNTLFVGRLAYEVTERKLLREMESFGPVKDIRIIKDRGDGSAGGAGAGGAGRSRGYAFVEYEHEEDMKRAYRAADGMRIEGREIVVDVERGHTVPTWLPRRLGGGRGGTRLGGKDVNVTRPGRYDPSQPDAPSAPAASMHPPPPSSLSSSSAAPVMGMGRAGGPGPAGPYGSMGSSGTRGGPSGYRDGPPGPPPAYGLGRGGGGGDRYGGPPPPPRDYDRDRGGGRYGGDRGSGRDHGRKRHRSPSPDRRHGGAGGGRRRY